MSKHFVVLYTTQKRKKAKRWKDGKASINLTNKKASVYDEDGVNRVDWKFLPRSTNLDTLVGEELEFPGTLVQFEEEVISSSPPPPTPVVVSRTTPKRRIVKKKKKKKRTMKFPPRKLIKNNNQSDYTSYTDESKSNNFSSNPRPVKKSARTNDELLDFLFSGTSKSGYGSQIQESNLNIETSSVTNRDSLETSRKIEKITEPILKINEIENLVVPFISPDPPNLLSNVELNIPIFPKKKKKIRKSRRSFKRPRKITGNINVFQNRNLNLSLEENEVIMSPRKTNFQVMKKKENKSASNRIVKLIDESDESDEDEIIILKKKKKKKSKSSELLRMKRNSNVIIENSNSTRIQKPPSLPQFPSPLNKVEIDLRMKSFNSSIDIHKKSNNTISQSSFINRPPRNNSGIATNSSISSDRYNNNNNSNNNSNFRNSQLPSRIPRKQEPSILDMVGFSGQRLRLFFPSPQFLGNKITRLPQPNEKLPFRYSSIVDYTHHLLSFLYETMNYYLFDVSLRFFDSYNTFIIHQKNNTSPNSSFGNYSRNSRNSNFRNNNTNNNSVKCSKCSNTAQLRRVKKEGVNKGRYFYSCSGKQCKFFIRWYGGNIKSSSSSSSDPNHRLVNMFHENIKNLRNFVKSCLRKNIFVFSGSQIIRKKNYYQNNNNNMNNMNNNSKNLYYLRIDEDVFSGIFKSSGLKFKLCDVYVLSKTIKFQAPFIIIKSECHGPSSNTGLLLCSVLSGNVNDFCGSGNDDGDCIALKIQNFWTEFELLKIITHLPLNLPLLNVLLGKIKKKDPNQSIIGNSKSSIFDDSDVFGDEENIENIEKKEDFIVIDDEDEDEDDSLKLANKYILKYGLNKDQAKVIIRASLWFSNHKNSEKNIHLVRDFENLFLVKGVFGSGKTYLLVVLILFLDDLFQSRKINFRILVTSVTNVAVDNILLGLLGENFTEFLRIGSQRKINKLVLPYTIHTSQEANESEEEKESNNNKKKNINNVQKKNELLKELKRMISGPDSKDLSKKELESIKERILELEKGEGGVLGESKKLEKLKSSRIVGVTCSACTFDILNSENFDLLIMDEATQCNECLSLLPLSKFKVKYCILVGDPNQLPPVSDLPIFSNNNNNSDEAPQTLYHRLINIIGVSNIIKLRTQYRCHPQISLISNELFYNNELIDGISKSDRSSVISCLPPVMFVDCFLGKELKSTGGSYFNTHEVSVIGRLIEFFKMDQVCLSKIGVITLYKSQASKISNSLKVSARRKLKISTIDAFQGGEREIIIISTVRTGDEKSLISSFFEDPKRSNVAITRARRHLILIGMGRILKKTRVWKKVIEMAEELNGVWNSTKILAGNNFGFLRDRKRRINKKKKINKFSILEDDDDDEDEDDEDEEKEILFEGEEKKQTILGKRKRKPNDEHEEEEEEEEIEGEGLDDEFNIDDEEFKELENFDKENKLSNFRIKGNENKKRKLR